MRSGCYIESHHTDPDPSLLAQCSLFPCVDAAVLHHLTSPGSTALPSSPGSCGAGMCPKANHLIPPRGEIIFFQRLRIELLLSVFTAPQSSVVNPSPLSRRRAGCSGRHLSISRQLIEMPKARVMFLNINHERRRERMSLLCPIGHELVESSSSGTVSLATPSSHVIDTSSP